jgi:hypothetical protein
MFVTDIEMFGLLDRSVKSYHSSKPM